MDRLKEYRIALKGLGEGKHSFEFVLDDEFFDCFEATKGTKGKVDAMVEIRKSSLLQEVRIKMAGTVKATCDRCLGPMDLAIEGAMSLYVKQHGREEGNDDDYIVLSPEDDFLDVGSYLYETYMLNYPIRVVHPDGKCEENMQDVLRHYISDEEKKTDPRWDELKKLISN